MDVNKIIQEFLKTLPKQKQKEFLQEFQELSPEEQQEFIGALAQQMQQPQAQPLMKKGGKVKSDAGFLEDYLSKMSEEEQDLVISQLESMSPQERTNSIQYMKCGGKLEFGGSYQQGGMLNNLPVEVEGGETLYTPDQQLQKFEGPKHSEGGIDVMLPEGSKIFSEHLKVPNEIYETVFNKTTKGKKKSFADLSKRFPTEPYQKVLEDPNSDDYQKQTASYSLERNKANLNLLFEAQEGMKASKERGKMLKYGGKLYAQEGLNMEYRPQVSGYDMSRVSDNFIPEGNGMFWDPQSKWTFKRNEDGTYKAIAKFDRPMAEIRPRGPVGAINRDYEATDNTGRGPMIRTNDPASLSLTPSLIQTVKGASGQRANLPIVDEFGIPNLIPQRQEQVFPEPVLGTPVPNNFGPGESILGWRVRDRQGTVKGTHPSDKEYKGTIGEEEKVPTVVTPKKGKSKVKAQEPKKEPNPVIPPTIVDEPAPSGQVIDDGIVPFNPQRMVPVVSQRAAPSINLTGNEQEEEKKKKKRYYGIDDKLAGTALDIMAVLSDNIKIDGPQYRDNRKYPLFSRYVDFEDKTAAKMLDKSIQQIQNSNMPQQVKQSMIANAQAQFADQQGQHDMQNAQRYEAKIQGDTQKLQSYLDSNVDQATQDIDVYRQKKAQVEYLRDQFKAKRKEQIVNSARNYFDYTSKVNKMNQLYSDNYDYNPITGRVVFEGSKQDPLKQQEQLIAQYAKSGQNQVSLPNGASLTILNDTVGILTDRDGKTQYVDLSKGQGRQQPQSGQNPWGL